MTKVLMISNDSTLKHFINVTLTYNGFTVHTVSDSQNAWLLLKEVRFDFIISDYQLKNESGLSFYKALRTFGSHTPVLMIGEGVFDEFMLKDLSTDHYDYLLKPFKFEALKEKMNGLMEVELEVDYISYGDFRIGVRKHLVSVKDKFIQIGNMEMEILILLAKKPGEVAEGLLFNMTTSYYVRKLRRKLKKIAGEALDICLVKNIGYRLVLNI